MFGLAAFTALKRWKYQVFIVQEDVKFFATQKYKEKKPEHNNDAVERVRRNHLNDIENIPAFLALGLLYVASQPNPVVALWHFRGFIIFRFLHTLSYQLPIPQPARALTYIGGLFTCISMAFQLIRRSQWY